jgi:hypothetical protein
MYCIAYKTYIPVFQVYSHNAILNSIKQYINTILETYADAKNQLFDKYGKNGRYAGCIFLE